MKTKMMTILAGFALVLMASCGGSSDKGGENGEGGEGGSSAKYGLDKVKQEGALKEAYQSIEAIVTAMNTGKFDNAYKYMEDSKSIYMQAFVAVANQYAGGFTLPATSVKECKVIGEGDNQEVECKLDMEGESYGRRLLFKKTDGKWLESFLGLSLNSMKIKGEKGEFTISGYSFDNLGGEGYMAITINGEETKVLITANDNGEVKITGEEGDEPADEEGTSVEDMEEEKAE